MKKINIFNTEFKLTLLAIFFLFVIKVYFVKSLPIILLTSLYDISIFFLFFTFFFILKIFIPLFFSIFFIFLTL